MKAIRYLRFSSDGQSQHSIERQEMVTSSWIKFNGIELIDTFIDEGVSARTFDRPDIQSLFAFIKKNHRNIDYMLVSELTRFSREAGDAINMIKKIQFTYGVRIVSASRSVIYDCSDSNSFFMMGLEFLLGNSENIKRQNDINGGIYTAKAEKGKWIQGGPAPFGFRKEGIGDERKMIQVDEEVNIIRFIFNAWLQRTPLYIIKQQVKALGFRKTSSDAVSDILKNPLYMGYQNVKAWKNMPGGLFPLKNVEPIVSVEEWNNAQVLFKRPDKQRLLLNDAFPLRGIVKCYCGKPLTGAPSKSRNGRYYPYYKCTVSGHVNKNSNMMHNQLMEIFSYMNLPQRIINAVVAQSETLMQERLQQNQKLLLQKRTAYSKLQNSIELLEEKWITNQVNFETYNRWHSTYNEQRITLNASIEGLQKNSDAAQFVLRSNIQQLSALDVIYEKAGTTAKQEILRRVFDNSLYYKNSTYRTAYVMPVFSHNLLILKQKQLLEVDAFEGIDRSGGGQQAPIEPLIDFIAFIESLKVA